MPRRKLKPVVDGYVERDEFTLKVLEVHRGNEITIRNQFGYPERVKLDDVGPADPDKVAAIKRRIEGVSRRA